MPPLATEIPCPIHCSATILFAEDDPAIRSIVTELLTTEGYFITTVESGDKAAVLLDFERFDLLLTDVRMPGIKDGIELARYAWTLKPELPVVIVSGFAQELALRLDQLKGNVRFLAKPFRFGELTKTIRSCLSPSVIPGAKRNETRTPIGIAR